MGGCQNYGPFLGTANIRCRIILGIQNGTIINLTSTHMVWGLGFRGLGLGSRVRVLGFGYGGCRAI